ncbi:MAG TPA: PAS domain S-box protein [Candidatus Tectomicrobia bacterium]|nr:PAS domain S-box protein [Candidatus Tectomicrobia bacterium]
MARRMRAFDWSTTDLGPPQGWPENLRMAVSLCLTSRFPILIWWGPTLSLLYNDAYIPFLGEKKHPRCLGQPGRDCWAEIWDTIGPMLESVHATGEATWSDDSLYFFARRLPREEVYVTFTYGPILAADGRSVQGVFCPCTETTERVVGARRLETLRKLGAQALEGRGIDAACEGAAKVLAENPLDIPFAAIYLVNDAGTHAVLKSLVGFSEDAHPFPSAVSLAEGDLTPWPLASVLQARRAEETSDLTEGGLQLPGGPWPEPSSKAIVLPIFGAQHESLIGLAVLGVGPRRVLDDAYRTFFDLTASHIGTAISDAKAYEAEQKRAEAFYTAELASGFRSAIEKAGLQLRVDCPALPELVLVDREMWEKIILNLLSNAFKFTFEGAVKSEERVRHYFELGLIGMATTSPTKGIIEVNDEICKILGYERSELLQMTWAKLTHPDDLAADVAQFNRVMAGEVDGYSMDKRWIRKDGQLIDTTVSVKCLRRADGSVEHFVALLQDITERKRAEEALRRAHDELEQRVIERTSQLSALNEELIEEITERKRAEEALHNSLEALIVISDELRQQNQDLERSRLLAEQERLRYQELFEFAPDGYLMTTKCGTIQEANRAAASMLGISPRVLVGEHLPSLIAEQARQEFRRKLADLWHVDKAQEWEVLLQPRDGECFAAALMVAPIRGWEGRPTGLRWLLRDITERKLAEEALRQAQAGLAHVSRVTSLGELTALIAHEVNQPLGAIVTNGQACLRLLARESPDLNKSREVVERMISDGLRASEVITRTRALLKKRSAEKALLHVNEIIQEVIALTSTELATSEIHLQTALAADLPPVLGDRVQLQQVLLNLILNAKEAMSGVGWQPRELFITSLASESGEAVVAVRDSGTGLDPRDCDRIFEAFFTTKAEGLGLGLSISRTIIEAHGGRLWASSGEGQGSSIQFALPAGGRGG